MKPFDIKKAQAGEPILLVLGSEYDTTPVRFIGLLTDGRNVVERKALSGVYYCEVCVDAQLRMAPKKRTVYVNVYSSRLNTIRNHGNQAAVFDDEEGARDNARGNGVGLIAIAIPIEIEE